MSFEPTKDGKLALRVEVRSFDDGWTRAGLRMPEGWMVLATIPTPPYEASTDVQAAFIALAQAVTRQALNEAMPGIAIEGVHGVAPGAPLDGPKH
jgi:hypothetical protein